MFDLLKKKLSGFVEKIAGKREEPPEEPKEAGPVFEEIKEAEVLEREEIPPEKPPEKEPVAEKPPPKPEIKEVEVRAPAVAKGPSKAEIREEKPVMPPEAEVEKPREEKRPEKAPEAEKPEKIIEERKPTAKEPKGEAVGQVAERVPEKLEKKVKKGLFAAVKETISGTSEIREGEIAELLEDLELGLLESDVALEVADEIKAELKRRVSGAKVQRGKTAEFIREQLRQTLIELVETGKAFCIPERVRALEKPVKVMVLGPNGSGKTTTIAKITKMLQDEGFTVVIAASDTFRAAAVEQLQHHGDKLGVKVISGAYGSDPTALAFDAVEYAKAHKMDVVLIDTAGRQDTNLNLLNQLKKMDRVIAPQIKIYVGESIAGNAITEQAAAFHKEIGLDGVILTKLDCDAKGGTVVSISKITGVPIIYVGTGQKYGDIEPFDAGRMVGEILS